MRPALPVLAILLVPFASAIYGGTDAPEGAYPWMVHLYVGEPHEGIVCGGSLIAPRYVLTAAHCVPNEVDAALGPNPISGGERIEDYRALIGRADLLGEGGETIEAIAAYAHPDHQAGLPPAGAVVSGADIAIIELARPSTHPTLRVAGADETHLYPAGTIARVIGWGCTPELCFPSRLQQVDVPVRSDAECAAAPNYVVMFDPEHEVCAGAEGVDSCGGDSGGPLFVYDESGPVVFGIVGYGAAADTDVDPSDPMGGIVPCGSGQHPGVYAEVAAHADFLAPFLE